MSTRTPAARRLRAARRLLTGRLEDRLAGTLDRRVRLEVARRLAELGPLGERLDATVRRVDGLLDEAAVLALVHREVARQAEVDRPDPGQRDRDFTAGLVLGAGRPDDRTLSAALVEDLRAEIRAVSGVEDVEVPLRRAYRALLDHESRGLGRIAGTTPNILGKLVVPTLLAPPPGPVLEIGTLFGLFSSALVRQLQAVGEFRTLTVVDPFAGTQVQDGRPGRRDRTGTPVSEEVARRNLTTLGLRAEEVRLVRGYSGDEEVRRQVAEQSYAVVVVDGDHAADGVYRDLRWVQDVVAPGGVVVLDDWGDPGWPGVEAAGRRYLADGGRLELVGVVATSAYLRRP
ncbi:Methyltransferase domain-containing protein [Friedmanniella luteola]|uniref:Methyltransferase domain-containing protein n=1 Tax=Friedmanniella luteola TaxID=546871 RepID=A0A1H1UJA5_9ACTN|nr:class I SAM-dependent methyltransferase [Friedmanniella luteola]SDS71909.1 Methyltransferase domain-containing protein [Friedmanniella luteola]